MTPPVRFTRYSGIEPFVSMPFFAFKSRRWASAPRRCFTNAWIWEGVE